MPRTSGERRWDERVWSLATLYTAVVMQVVLGALAIATQILRGLADPTVDVVANFRSSLLAASGIILVTALLVGGVLVTRHSPELRGLGVTVAASGLVASLLGVAYVFWIR